MFFRLLNDPAKLLLTIPALIWALSFHEFCHGLAAWWAGDPTAERAGRLSLNPLDHFDLVGTLMLLICGFGWAKPVPINARYFKHPKLDLIIVSLAGVAGNILTAVLTVLFWKFAGDRVYLITGRTGIRFLEIMISLNLGLAAFNLIPIPPLDGSRVLEAFLPYKYMRYYWWLESYGMWILLALLFTGIIDVLFYPIMSVFYSFAKWLINF